MSLISFAEAQDPMNTDWLLLSIDLLPHSFRNLVRSLSAAFLGNSSSIFCFNDDSTCTTLIQYESRISIHRNLNTEEDIE